MPRYLWIVLASLSLGRSLAPAAALAAAATLDADQIIARNVAARGGLERLRSLQSLRLTGRQKSAEGVLAAPAVKARTVLREQGKGSGE